MSDEKHWGDVRSCCACKNWVQAMRGLARIRSVRARWDACEYIERAMAMGIDLGVDGFVFVQDEKEPNGWALYTSSGKGTLLSTSMQRPTFQGASGHREGSKTLVFQFEVCGWADETNEEE